MVEKDDLFESHFAGITYERCDKQLEFKRFMGGSQEGGGAVSGEAVLLSLAMMNEAEQRTTPSRTTAAGLAAHAYHGAEHTAHKGSAAVVGTAAHAYHGAEDAAAMTSSLYFFSPLTASLYIVP